MSLSKGQDHWSEEDILMLLECMENNLPPNDKRKFKTTQSHMNWEKVAFKDFSGEMCKNKWLEISYSLRKYRTLKELVLEAQEHVKNPFKNKRFKKHPDIPKKPLTAYFHFFKEECSEYSQMYPELSKQELTKVLAKKYKELPEQMKRKYIQDFQKERHEFEEKLAQFKKDHPNLIQNPKKSYAPKKHQTQTLMSSQRNMKDIGSSLETGDFSKEIRFHGEPKKPPMNGYHKFYQDLWSSRELQHVPMRERMVEIGRRWQHIPQKLKDHYKNLAEELQKQYKVDLDLWLKSLSPKEYAAYKEATYAKRKNMSMMGGPNPKCRRMSLQCPSVHSLQEELGDELELQVTGTDSPETVQVNHHPSWGSAENKEDREEKEGSDSSDSSSEDEDRVNGSKESDSSSSSSEETDSS
ncbi:upstream-binding factor 1-like protein 1 [Orycteropus afer afer]|uniref:Upstream-binding factor 1-like protein 1 n=1 Tax=Orycteropus afer afer TaxID=1230840 RepID=A0A8B6ZKT8_ORYAF|nr:upstream-binding factor 1-like protein 1 [Orycteropus afer afer]